MDFTGLSFELVDLIETVAITNEDVLTRLAHRYAVEQRDEDVWEALALSRNDWMITAHAASRAILEHIPF
jgi:hypothetical protein